MRSPLRWLCVVSSLVALCVAQEKPVPAQPKAAAAAHGYDVSGVVVNATTGEPLTKAKVQLTPVVDDTTRDMDQQQGPRRGGGPGGGPGGGGLNFQRGAGGGPGNRGERNAGANNEPDNNESPEAMTDENGRFTFKGINAGKYSLAAQRKNFPRQLLDRHGSFSTSVIVGAGKNTKDIVFRLMPDCGITGRVVDDFGEPVRQSQVILFARSTDSGENVVRRRSSSGTDQQGNFHFSHLTPGTYYIVVSAQPWYVMYTRFMPQVMQQNGIDQTMQKEDGDADLDVAYPLTYYSGATDQNDATPITLGAGDHFNAEMTLNTVQAMHVKVDNPDPSTPMQPMVMAQAFGTDVFVGPPILSRGKDGSAQIGGLPPGHYDVTLRAMDMASRGNGSGPPVLRRQMIDANGNVVIDLGRPSESAPVSGTVKFENAPERLPRGSVVFRKQDSSAIVAGRTGDDGQFNEQLLPGKYVVSATYSPYLMKDLTVKGAKLTGRVIEVTGTSLITVNVTMSKDVARVEGVVKTDDGVGLISGAMVMLVPEDPANELPLFRRYQSDTDGSFTFTNVLPGRYTLLALKKGWDLEWSKPDVLRNFVSAGEMVEVAPSARVKVDVKAQ